MKRRLVSLLVVALAPLAFSCGGPGSEAEGTLQIKLGANDAWPSTVNSARIAMTRSGGATGCGTATPSFSKCWCKVAGAGCDFVGDPTPTSAITGLCSGDWTLDTSVTAAYTASACAAGSELTTNESSTPGTVSLPYGGNATVNVIFQATSSMNVDVQFDG